MKIGWLIYPEVTQLDFTAPYQVFACLPDVEKYVIWKTLEPIKEQGGLILYPNTTFSDCPDLDIICVPGGAIGALEMMRDGEVLEFLRQKAQKAQYITSVCTGSLILAAAGLLQGYEAACHWMYRDCLSQMGVKVNTNRVVIDRNRITGGGVTAGIDFGLTLVATIYDEETAKFVQLLLEYNPSPPFSNVSSATVSPTVVNQLRQSREAALEAIMAESKQIGAKLKT